MLPTRLRSRIQIGLIAVLLVCGIVYVIIATWRNDADGQRPDETIWLDATINNKPLTLVFDTGATSIFIYDYCAQRLGLKVTHPKQEDIAKPLPPGMLRTSETEVVDLAVLGQTFRAALHVISLPAGTEFEYDGLIGWKPLSEKSFIYDGPARRLELVQTIPERALHWQKLKVSSWLGVLHFQSMETEGNDHAIFVDTGVNAGVCLPSEQWRKWRADHPDAPVTLTALYYPQSGGLEIREQCWAREIQLGPLTLTDVPVQETTDGDLNVGGPGYIGTMGFYAVWQTRLAVDGKALLAYVETLKNPGRPYPHNRLGAVFVSNGSDYKSLLAHVVPDSPAYQAGIRDGDRLLKVGELNTTEQTSLTFALALANFWHQPAETKLTLTLSRDGKEFKAYPVLRDLIGPGIGNTTTGTAASATK